MRSLQLFVTTLSVMIASPTTSYGDGSEPIMGASVGGVVPGASDPGGKINSDRDSNQVGGKCRPAAGVGMDQIERWYQADIARRGPNSQFRYVYIPPDMLGDEVTANLARIGLFKALNHTAYNANIIHIGEDVSEKHGVLYAIDTVALWGQSGPDKWGVVSDPLNQNGSGGQFAARQPFSPAPSIAAASFDPLRPAPADQVAYNAVYGNVYNELIDMPAQEPQLRERLGIGRDPVAFGAVKEAIVFGPRIFYLMVANNGLKYWVSADEFENNEGGNIPYSPNQLPNVRDFPKVEVFGTQAHEAWHEMPNGFNAYYIWGNAKQERSKAEQIFVVDPNNKRTGDLINGRSCITCHMSGVQAASSDLAGAGSNWTSNEELARLYGESRTRFQAAMREVVKVACNAPQTWLEDVVTASFKREPVNVLIQRVEGTGDGTLDMIWDPDSPHVTGGQGFALQGAAN